MVGGIIGRGLTLFDPPIELLSDVVVTSPSNGDTLVYNSTTKTWNNGAGGGGAVTQIIAGTNVTISPVGGTGAVTINSSGSGGGGGGGSSGVGRTVTSTSVTMLNTDGIVDIKLGAAASVAITGAAGRTAWIQYTIKDAGGTAGTNAFVYTPASGTIDGQASIKIQQNYDSVSIYSDGTNEYTM